MTQAAHSFHARRTDWEKVSVLIVAAGLIAGVIASHAVNSYRLDQVEKAQVEDRGTTGANNQMILTKLNDMDKHLGRVEQKVEDMDPRKREE